MKLYLKTAIKSENLVIGVILRRRRCREILLTLLYLIFGIFSVWAFKHNSQNFERVLSQVPAPPKKSLLTLHLALPSNRGWGQNFRRKAPPKSAPKAPFLKVYVKILKSSVTKMYFWVNILKNFRFRHDPSIVMDFYVYMQRRICQGMQGWHLPPTLGKFLISEHPFWVSAPPRDEFKKPRLGGMPPNFGFIWRPALKLKIIGRAKIKKKSPKYLVLMGEIFCGSFGIAKKSLYTLIFAFFAV